MPQLGTRPVLTTPSASAEVWINDGGTSYRIAWSTLQSLLTQNLGTSNLVSTSDARTYHLSGDNDSNRLQFLNNSNDVLSQIQGDGTTQKRRLTAGAVGDAVEYPISASGRVSSTGGIMELINNTGQRIFDFRQGSGNGRLNILGSTGTGILSLFSFGGIGQITSPRVLIGNDSNSSFLIFDSTYVTMNSVNKPFNVRMGTGLMSVYSTSIATDLAFQVNSTNGRVSMPNLPTSSAGLSAGDIWNNSGVLNIV